MHGNVKISRGKRSLSVCVTLEWMNAQEISNHSCL